MVSTALPWITGYSLYSTSLCYDLGTSQSRVIKDDCQSPSYGIYILHHHADIVSLSIRHGSLDVRRSNVQSSPPYNARLMCASLWCTPPFQGSKCHSDIMADYDHSERLIAVVAVGVQGGVVILEVSHCPNHVSGEFMFACHGHRRSPASHNDDDYCVLEE